MLEGNITSEVVRERQKYVNSLKHFVEEKKQELADVLEQLDFTNDSIPKVEVKQVCPYNASHHIPEKSFKKHIQKCRLLHAGYQKDELASQLANTDFCYEGKSSLKIELDENLLNRIVWEDCVQSGQVYTGHRSMPVSEIEEKIHLTQSDRLAIYNYVVAKSHEEGKVIPVDKSDELLTTDWGSLVKKGLLDAQNNEKYSSKLEQLAALRDMKRRRQSYRAKNVHITKKSYTEIIREVIVNQMQMLVPAKSSKSKTLGQSQGNKDDIDESMTKSGKRRVYDESRYSERHSSSHSRRRRSRSRSRNRDKRHRYSEERDRSDRKKIVKNYDKTERRRDEEEDTLHLEENSDLVVKLEPETSTQEDQTNLSIDDDSVSIKAVVSSKDKDESQGSTSHSSKSKKRKHSHSASSSDDGECSDDDEDHRTSRHKKSKHKKKSKHSKKHKKKQKN